MAEAKVIIEFDDKIKATFAEMANNLRRGFAELTARGFAELTARQNRLERRIAEIADRKHGRGE